MTVSDYPDYGTPDQHALSIFTQGVPLYGKPQVLVSQVNQTLAAGGGGQRFPASGFFSVPQTGYEILLSGQSQAGSTSPFLKFRIQWVDAASGQPVGDEEWIIPLPSSGPYGIVLTGLAKGDEAFIVIQNADSVTQTYTLIFRNNSLVYPRDQMRPMFNLGGATVPGFTLLPDIDMPQGLYGMGSVSAAANSTQTYLVGTYNGLLQIKSHFNSGSSGFIQMTPIDPFVTVPNGIFKQNVASPQDVMYTVYAPRCPVTFEVHCTHATVALAGDVNFVAAPATIN